MGLAAISLRRPCAQQKASRSGSHRLDTFHALGNSIIRHVENGAPALAPHASDDKQFSALLRDILFNDVATQPALAVLLLKWFSEFYWPYKSEWDFKTKDEYFQYVESHELRTLQGDLVKSFEEWEIRALGIYAWVRSTPYYRLILL